MKKVFQKLLNTSNPNLICQLSIKKTVQDKKDIQAFEDIMIKEE